MAGAHQAALRGGGIGVAPRCWHFTSSRKYPRSRGPSASLADSTWLPRNRSGWVYRIPARSCNVYLISAGKFSIDTRRHDLSLYPLESAQVFIIKCIMISLNIRICKYHQSTPSCSRSHVHLWRFYPTQISSIPTRACHQTRNEVLYYKL